jgi:glycine oxidase
VSQPELLVVGGGIVGLSVAWQAARCGLAVTVVDPAPGQGASWAAAGMLAPVTEARAAEAALADLGLASLARWPAFAETLASDAGCSARDLGLRQQGTLAVAFDEDDLRALAEFAAVAELLGLAAERCSAQRCRQLEPLLTPRLRGGLLVHGDWQVDPRRVVPALLQALDRRGVRLRRQSVVGLVTDPPELAGGQDDTIETGAGLAVALDDGTVLEAPVVVIAAGASSGTLPGLPPEAVPPVRPVKGEILRLGPGRARALLGHVVRGTVRGLPVYLVSRDGGELVVGATMEEAGWDTDVRAGAVRDLLWAATELVPEVGELAVVECRAGLRPATPDNGPVLGPTPVAGLHLATGHFRNGVLLAPITAETVVAGITGDPVPDVAGPFRLDRFASRARVGGAADRAAVGGAAR